MDGHTMTVDAVFRNWIVGSVDGLPYTVKVCDVESEYGIDEGRIIKLYLFAADGEKEIATYERGWGKYPALKYENSIMNPASILMWAHEITREQFITSYVTGFPVDAVHAAATWVFLWFAAEPMLEKLDRIKVKYGLVE